MSDDSYDRSTPPTPATQQQRYYRLAPPPQKKSRLGLVIGLVAGLLVLCVLSTCGVTAVVTFNAAKQRALLRASERHYSAAQSAVATAAAEIAGIGKDPAVDKAVALANAQRSLGVGRQEIATARSYAVQLADSPGKGDYLASLQAADECLAGMEQLIAGAGRPDFVTFSATTLPPILEAGKRSDDLRRKAIQKLSTPR